MKNKCVIIGVFALIVIFGAWSAIAAPYSISDNYIGADEYHYNQHYGDVIGDPGLFDIQGANLSLHATILQIDIYTNFAGLGDDGLFSGYSNGLGIGYGDLFLSNQWTPYGDSLYVLDDYSNGTIWNYGFALDNRWGETGGDAVLFSLDSRDDALLSEDFMTGAIYRNGQEVAVNTESAGVDDIQEGKWEVHAAEGYIRFLIDINGIDDLLNTDQIALHWAMTCGNDVIEGAGKFPPVPEPATMLLLGTGLICLAGLGRKKFVHC
ncbi:MAG: PEP-CTERM sorting domain-containing protein [Deltaproteobacteria bacterium]|nr:PEP-CTERM sorting domain-containing protein [Deltaproteobacteria bacterium]